MRCASRQKGDTSKTNFRRQNIEVSGTYGGNFRKTGGEAVENWDVKSEGEEER